MSAVLVPLVLDVLMVREVGVAEDWALIAVPPPKTAINGSRRAKLTASPFQSLPEARPKGAYLHWALPDALTRGSAGADTAKAWFPPLPDRWLVLRLTGDTRAGPRALAAWLIPDAGARTALHLADALAGPMLPPAEAAPVAPLTALGHGDLGWAAYHDNVQDRFALYDDLAGVTGPVAYLVCGWYSDATSDPVGASASASDFADAMKRLGWQLQVQPSAGAPFPTRSVYHAAALSLGWPAAAWDGDGGSLGSEPDLRPDAEQIDLALGETLAEAIAALATPVGGTQPAGVGRLLEGRLANLLGDAAAADGPATLDTALHLARFGSTPSVSDTEFIWEPAAPSDTDAGSFRPAKRAAPRVFHAIDPALAVRGAGRSARHGGDGRYTTTGFLLCRLEAETVTGFGVSGGDPGHGAAVLPAAPLRVLPADYGVPAVAGALLVELASLDPGSAPDLAQATPTVPSPVAAARARWWAAFDPSVPASQALAGAAVEGVLPCPVGVTTPMRPWNPIHLDWRAAYLPSPRGAHDWALGEVDFDLPAAPLRPAPDPAYALEGRTMLSPGAAAMLHAAAGSESGMADDDLLSGALADLCAQLRGDSTDALVQPPGTPAAAPDLDVPPDFIALRAGFLAIERLRLVDGFGQIVDLIGGTRTTPRPVAIGATLAVEGQADLAALRPRFTAPGRCMLRFVDATGRHVEADAGVSPVCGYVIPSSLDGTLEFFDAEGAGYGRLRPDAASGSAWEDDPGRQSALGVRPSSALPNPFLGGIADALLAADTAAAGARADAGALRGLVSLLDITNWSVDATGRAGDEHLSLLLGHPIAVVRALLKIEVQDPRQPAVNERTSVPVKLGTLAHLQDGLLGYYVGDTFDRVHSVDPALAELAAVAGLPSMASPYIDPRGSFNVNAGVEVPLTLLMVPGSDLHVSTGLLPQKKLSLLRDWTAPALTRLSPALRFGPLLRDREATRLPVAPDIRGNWFWHRRDDPSTWVTDEVVPATTAALLPETRVEASDGWLQVKMLADTNRRDTAIQVGIDSVQKHGGTLSAICGANADGSRFALSIQQAIQFLESGRFAFFVGNPPVYLQIVHERNGRKYLRTSADDSGSNNLEHLPLFQRRLVPDVVGLTLPSAQAAITTSGLTAGGATRRFDPAPLDNVIGQWPAAGMAVDDDSAVDLTVSDGPPATVPSVVGQPLATARMWIGDSALVVGRVQRRFDAHAADQVIRQQPAAGTQLKRGSAMDLSVSDGPAVVVPNVVGKTLATARNDIVTSGLVVRLVTRRMDSQPFDEVVMQSPPAGSLLKQLGPVDLGVSDGPPVTVPNVVGLTIDAAGRTLLGVGLSVGGVTRQFDDSRPADEVIAQMPVAGTVRKQGTSVALTASDGPAATVPNLVGQSLAAARSMIAAAGLSTGDELGRFDAQALNQVIEQQPAAGTRVHPGSTVGVTFSKGPAVTVPKVVGQSLAAARNAVSAAGLSVGTVVRRFNAKPVDEVIEQYPLSGTQVAAGSAVDLIASDGPSATVPNVVGRTITAASADIVAAALSVGTVQRRSDARPADEVLEQQPAANSVVGRGSAVSLVASDGPLVTVPNVVGQGIGTARTNIVAAGLTVGAVQRRIDPGTAVDLVLAQNPAAGAQVKRDSAVALAVSDGAGATVPDVIGEQLVDATTLIGAAGLVLGFTLYFPPSDKPRNEVIGQNPQGGSKLPHGGSVALNLSDGSIIVTTT